jgi:hypothetical protein
MWGMVGETLRDESHGRMQKVIKLVIEVLLPRLNTTIIIMLV